MIKLVLFLCLISLISCSPPAVPICAQDGPNQGICAWTTGNNPDFHVDDVGHNFTQFGRNWSWDQLKTNSLILPADSWAKLKAYLLEQCHNTSTNCNPAQLEARLNELEGKLIK